jgi:hypothetical protein
MTSLAVLSTGLTTTAGVMAARGCTLRVPTSLLLLLLRCSLRRLLRLLVLLCSSSVCKTPLLGLLHQLLCLHSCLKKRVCCCRNPFLPGRFAGGVAAISCSTRPWHRLCRLLLLLGCRSSLCSRSSGNGQCPRCRSPLLTHLLLLLLGRHSGNRSCLCPCSCLCLRSA